MARPTDTEEQIGEQIAEMHGAWYGRRPSSARTWVGDGVVVVLLEETFTDAERGLIQRNETEGIREIRQRWQQAMAEELKGVVTQATGQQVRAFVSDSDLEEAIAIEVFVLGEGMEDMQAFEQDVETGEQPSG